ncbi:MAG: type IA DNA topoisomerase [Butyrivibrio sp.]|nr:type IA DNA topoisomerase [Butyrivibrio sp.]
MSKCVYIAEKPSVAQAFGNALKENYKKMDGYWESDNSIITWCVGHLVSMSYPEKYDEKYKRWSLETIPFIPENFKYEVIGNVKKQFKIVSGLLNRADVDVIYICTDSGREGEYIYRLVDKQAGVKNKIRKRVWIDSQTDEEILRGIREAKDDSEYDNIGAAAYLRAKEDYLMGINFSRALTLRYGYSIRTYLNIDKCVIAVGRVMTCVLGIVVEREREIREFVKTPFYRVVGTLDVDGSTFDAEWRVQDKSKYFNSPALYSEKGFKDNENANILISLLGDIPVKATVLKCEKKNEVKKAPLLYNLAELQNDCAKLFKISPDETLAIAQELYEKKMTTYPRTDARVLSTAISKVISNNIKGLQNYDKCSIFAKAILQHESYKGIEKTKYVNDKAITDHYAIIPTGQGLQNLAGLSATSAKVYEIIVRRFLAIFYPDAKYKKVSLETVVTNDTLLKNESDGGSFEEHFYSNLKVLVSKGYLHVMDYSFAKKKDAADKDNDDNKDDNEAEADESLMEKLEKLRKGSEICFDKFDIKEGETKPPKRFNSGTLILTMENAGQFIEDEELRAQIKGSGIGTSATRAGILTKLDKNKYLKINKKTQIVTPTQLGEMIYETVACSMKPMLNPTLTASWEKGLAGVEEGSVTEKEYMDKLDDFVTRRTNQVKEKDYRSILRSRFDYVSQAYKK